MNKKTIILIAILQLFLISCTQFDVELIKPDTNFVKPPDMEFFGFKRESYITNFKQLDLFATNAKIYESRNMMELYSNQAFTYEADGKVSASILSELSLINQETMFVQFYTNVIVKFSNDSTLYTEYLEWHDTNKKFKTPEAVRLEQDNGSWLTGVGMEGDLDLEAVTIYNEVDEGDEFGVQVEEQ